MRPFIRGFLNVVILILFLAGVWTALTWLLRLIHAVSGTLHVNVGSAWAAVVAFFHEDAAIWLSAIATLMVYWATRNLVRISNVQFARNGPMLRVDLLLAAPAGARLTPYYTEWDAEDRVHPYLSHHLIPNQSTPVYLAVANVQGERSAVAADVAVTVALYFDSPTGIAPHPHSLVRTIRVPIIDPGTYVVGPALNTGTLDAYLAVVRSVEYADISDRRRTAGWGTNVIAKLPGRAASFGQKVFKPRRGEFSDAHR